MISASRTSRAAIRACGSLPPLAFYSSRPTCRQSPINSHFSSITLVFHQYFGIQDNTFIVQSFRTPFVDTQLWSVEGPAPNHTNNTHPHQSTMNQGYKLVISSAYPATTSSKDEENEIFISNKIIFDVAYIKLNV